MANSLPEQLLEHADQVVASSPRRNDQASLRRALSTAYYAVFHLICEDAAILFAGSIPRRKGPLHDLNRYAMVYRSLDHRQLRKICVAIQSPKVERSISGMLPSGVVMPELAQFAAIAAELQEARLRADYDPIAPFEIADVIARVQSARLAFVLYEKVQEEQPAVNRAVFLTQLMINKRQ